MTSTRALAVASLFLALAGCQTAPDPAAKPKVAAMLPGTWGSDGPDHLGLTFRDDGTFTAAENRDIKDVSPFGPHEGTYRWVDDRTLNLTYRGGAKPPAPPAGDYRVSIKKERMKGVDKDKGGPRWKDYDRFTMHLESSAGKRWRLTRDGD